MPGSKKRRSFGGSLWVISGFLVASAIVRVGSEAGQVLAKETPVDGLQNQLDTSPKSCEPPPDLKAMMNVFRKREGRLDEREKELLSRARALEVTGQEVDAKLAELEAAEDELRDLISVAQTAAEDDLSRLTNVYESMKPKEAAALFEQMDPEFAAGFLSRMSPEAAAGVMAGLTPQVAYTISVVLAGRNANAPTE